jgi:PAS domain S-box-containing protein
LRGSGAAASGVGTTNWLALSRQALLHQVTHGNAAHSLSLLRRHLADARRHASIGWLAEGQQRWVDNTEPQPSAALFAVWAGAPAQRADGCWWLPLDHLSTRVGVLCVSAADDDILTAFEPLCEAAAALAAACAQPRQPTSDDGPLLRTALRGAGTFVWEWHPGTDELSDIDEGFEMLGYAPDRFAPTQANWDLLIHADDLEDNHAAYLRHERGEVEQYEHIYRARGADDRWHWLHERGRIVERGLDGSPRRMLGTQTDITSQRELETQASADRERLALIARHVPGVLYQFMQTGNGQLGWFSYVSERCEAIFGVASAELTADASALLRRVHPDWRERLRSSLAVSATLSAQWRLEFPIRRRDGADRWLLGAASPQRDSDGRTAWFGYIADVTDLRELEAASRDKAAAEAASRAKTEFLSRMSHELRTPLNAVLGFSQLLELSPTPPLADAHRRPVQLIREAGEHLLTMIGDLLDLTRIESGHLRLQIDSVALAPLADECVALMQAQAASAQVSVGCSPCAGLLVQADRTRLKQVLLNLLSNGVKYNRVGGAVTLRARSDGGRAVIEVSDTGVGIAAEHLARVFEPFQRGAHGQSSIEGTGIGLAVSKSLVELMDGSIDVHSTPGKGSLFTVRLPSVDHPRSG